MLPDEKETVTGSDDNKTTITTDQPVTVGETSGDSNDESDDSESEESGETEDE